MGVVTFGSQSYKSGIPPAKSGRTRRVTTVPSGTSVGSAGTSQVTRVWSDDQGVRLMLGVC